MTGGKSTQREKVMHEGAEKQGTRSEDVASRLERHPVIKARITKLLDLKVPEGFLGKLSLLPRLLEVSKFPPRTVSALSSVCAAVDRRVLSRARLPGRARLADRGIHRSGRRTTRRSRCRARPVPCAA